MKRWGIVGNVIVRDMVRRTHFSALHSAILKSTDATEETKFKAGLKISLYYLLKKLSKVIKSNLLVEQKDDEAAEVDRFGDILSMNYNFIFGDAMYTNAKNREVKLRRPENLPQDEDVELVRRYTINRMDELSDTFRLWTSTDYIELRDLADSRLTLFNARRGGEPARLTITNWLDALNDVWLDPIRLKAMDEVDRAHFKDLKVIYQSGKGNHLVPFLVPHDTIPALNRLCDVEIRAQSDVSPTNHYLFPSTQQSNEHVYGWYAVHKDCVSAGVKQPNLLTATKMRHRISTIYAALEVPENQRTNFYKHMGHSANINATIYQTPPAEIEVGQIGRILQSIDNGASSNELIHVSSISNTMTAWQSANINHTHGTASTPLDSVSHAPGHHFDR